MNITKENIDALNAVLKVEIGKDDYYAKVDVVLKDYRKKAQIPGFRPGKVPFGMVRKMYGRAVMLEEVNKLLSESVSKYIFDEKIKILGDPLPNEEKQEMIDQGTFSIDEQGEEIDYEQTQYRFGLQLGQELIRIWMDNH